MSSLALTLLVEDYNPETRLGLPFQEEQGAFHVLAFLHKVPEAIKAMPMRAFGCKAFNAAYPGFLRSIEHIEGNVTCSGKDLQHIEAETSR